MRNNIFVNNSDAVGDYVLYWSGSPGMPTVDHNIYYMPNKAGDIISWGGSLYGSTIPFNSWSAIHTGDMNSDPSFVNN